MNKEELMIKIDLLIEAVDESEDESMLQCGAALRNARRALDYVKVLPWWMSENRWQSDQEKTLDDIT